jgi:hypothetical protein
MFRKIAYQIGYLTLIIALLSACQPKPVATTLSSSPTPAAQTTPPPPINATEVATFFDELMRRDHFQSWLRICESRETDTGGP